MSGSRSSSHRRTRRRLRRCTRKCARTWRSIRAPISRGEPMTDGTDLLQAHLLDERDWIGANEICRVCRIELTAVVELADLGVISPRGYAPEEWQFPATALPRLRTVSRLMRDLGVNASGAALAVELLEEQHHLQQRLRRLERPIHE